MWLRGNAMRRDGTCNLFKKWTTDLKSLCSLHLNFAWETFCSRCRLTNVTSVNYPRRCVGSHQRQLDEFVNMPTDHPSRKAQPNAIWLNHRGLAQKPDRFSGFIMPSVSRQLRQLCKQHVSSRSLLQEPRSAVCSSQSSVDVGKRKPGGRRGQTASYMTSVALARLERECNCPPTACPDKDLARQSPDLR